MLRGCARIFSTRSMPKYPKTKAEVGKVISTTKDEVAVEKSFRQKMREIYLDERLMDNERRIQSYNLLICEFGSELKYPRDTEPRKDRLDAETGKIVASKSRWRPQKTIQKQSKSS